VFGKFDLGLQLWTLISFLGLLSVLAKYAFRPLQRAMLEREAAIRDTIDQAKRSQAEAARLLEENRVQLEAAREAALRIMEEGRQASDKMIHDAEDKSRVESRAMIERAQEEIHKEVAKGVDRLRNTVVDLSLEVSSQFVKETMNQKRHEVLVDDAIALLKKKHEDSAIRN
jgi:F-type H+-transporting ATPase subunit b